MPDPRNLSILKEQSIADFGGGSLRGNGKDDHAPIGLYSGTVFELLLKLEMDWRNVYQIKRLRLRGTVTNQTHVVRGGSPRVKLRRLDEAFTEGGGAENSWSVDATTIFGETSSTGTVIESDSLHDSNGAVDTFDITAFANAWAPTSVLKSTGGPGGNEDNHGLRLFSYDDSSTGRTTEYYSSRVEAKSKRWEAILEYYDNRPPTIAVISPETPGSTPTIVSSASGTDLEVLYSYSDVDGDSQAGVVLEVWIDATVDATATEANAANGRYVLVSAAPTPTGVAGQFKVRATTLPARTVQKFRISAQDARGAWSGYTPLADGRIQTAYIPGVPLNPEFTPSQTPRIRGTLNGPGTISAWEGAVLYDIAGATQVMWPQTIVEVSGNPTRVDIPYGGIQLEVGRTYRWYHRLYNQDGVAGAWGGDYLVTIGGLQGSGIDIDLSEKLLSRTAEVTLNFPYQADGYQLRVYRTAEGATPGSGLLIHETAVTAIAAGTTADVAIPEAAHVAWGDYLELEAAARLTAAPSAEMVFGPRFQAYVNSLPSTTISGVDDRLRTGPIMGTTDILWYTPFSDVDSARYGDDPTGSELELREAATPQGSGTLVERRMGVDARYERTGSQLAAMDATTGWTAGGSVTLSAAATAPTDYSNPSLKLAVAGLAAGVTSVTYLSYETELATYDKGTRLRLWVRVSTLTNLDALDLVFEGMNGWVMKYDIKPLSAGAWVEMSAFKGYPSVAAGSLDWTLPRYIYVAVRAITGAYTGDVHVRDLRIGTTQTDKTVPDGHLEPEESYDARRRYHDDATPKAVTTLAAASIVGATTLKYNTLTSGEIEAGDELTIETPTGGWETVTVSAVGTVGSGGTGLTVSACLFAHANTDPAKVYYWGPWSSWITRKASEDPVVAASTPADAATVTDSTPSFVHTFTGSGGKAQASQTLRLYQRVDGVDSLLWEEDDDTTGLSITSPVLLLDTGATYAWEKIAYDTDGLDTTTTRRTFTTSFTRPAALANLAAATDEGASSVTLTWDAGSGVDHYRVYRRDARGQDVRIDAGPILLGDERIGLTDLTFTDHGARFGENIYTVTGHSGAVDGEGDPATVVVTLDSPDPGRWMLVHETNERYTTTMRVLAGPRSHGAIVESFAPPGRGTTLHRKWGRTGRSYSLRVQLRPAVDGDLSTLLADLQELTEPLYLKAPEGWLFEPLWGTVVSLADEPGVGGMMNVVSLDFEETERT